MPPLQAGIAPPSADELRARRVAAIARLYGAATAARLAGMKVAVIGIGGVGSWAAEALARSGVGALRLVDLDHIADSNINRQVHALEAEVGRAKVEAMAARIAAMGTGCAVETVDDFLTPDNAAALVAGCDVVLDCIDDIKAKTALAALARRERLALIVCGAAGGKRDATKVRIEDLARVRNDPLLARLRTKLRHEHGFPPGSAKKVTPFGLAAVFVDEPPATAPEVCAPGAALACAGYGSAMHVTAAVGLAAAGWLIELAAQQAAG
ncbi:tRNA threonylcarbamoyladenosine dehydratase [Derxia lacustris]|uniref:tRNA threonylcarbamoyladenosine dehydratase n=1 Tax=Derxia lacustris TaxID=764842 RepID=UPI001F22A6B7|nr:tRNA threonylcarbamoyladenosine dehydratase [Derxia lacustris]